MRVARLCSCDRWFSYEMPILLDQCIVLVAAALDWVSIGDLTVAPLNRALGAAGQRMDQRSQNLLNGAAYSFVVAVVEIAEELAVAGIVEEDDMEQTMTDTVTVRVVGRMVVADNFVVAVSVDIASVVHRY